MNAIALLTPAQNRLLNDLKAAGIQPEVKAKGEQIDNHDNGELYVAFQGRMIYAQKGSEWVATSSVNKIRKFITEKN